MTDISDQDLLNLIIEADDMALQEGIPPQGRIFKILHTVLNRFGYKNTVIMGGTEPEIVKRIRALHSSLYRQSDMAIGGIHGGIFMFRDVFTRISIPLMYGTVKINFLNLCDLSDNQKQWLRGRSADGNAYIDQAMDVFDFAGGIANLANFRRPPEDALPVFQNAGFHLQGAAATLSQAFDFRGAIQSSLIGAELGLKGALAAKAVSEEERTGYRHNLAKAAKAVAQLWPNFDLDRVLKVVAKLPPLVQNRYAVEQPGRVETGNIAMGCQYISAEAMRQVTGWSIREATTPRPTRSYPPL